MKIIVEQSWEAYRTLIYQGHQRFTLHEGSKTDCEWYAKMFRVALKNHDSEVIEKHFKGDAR